MINAKIAFVLIIALVGCYEAADTCISTPTDSSCSSYTLPTDRTTSLVNALCGVHNMPGCTMQQLCTEEKYRTSDVCGIFSTYKEICIDMPMMANCSTYTSMCATGTVISQCTAPVVDLPTTMETSNLIRDICTEMPMDGCDSCDHDCDLLTVYSNLCLAMPDMTQCTAWKDMCVSIPDWPLCSASANSNPVPIMRMYFHTGELDYILFKEWVPTSTGYYVGSWFAILFIGIFFEFVKLIRSRLELKWKIMAGQHKVSYEGADPSDIKIFDFSSPRPNWTVDTGRAVMHFLEYTLGLLLMLIAMTFNVGLFFAVCAGALIGNLFFGRYMQYEAKASCCS